MLSALLFAALLLLTGWLLWKETRHYRLLNTLEQELAQLTDAPPPLQRPVLDAALMDNRPNLITIEILNPMELAHKESKWAQTFGSMAPTLIRQIVYQRAAERVRTQLIAQGVEAEVKVLRA